MKMLFALMVTAILLALSAHAADKLEIRSAVAGTMNGVSNLVDDSYTWDPQNFPGFYYDLKKDMGTERLTATITEGNKLRGDPLYGIVYTTTAQQSAFKADEFGYYNVIGFIGERYFAGYINDSSSPAEQQIPLMQSTDPNSLDKGQLQKILMDDNTEIVVTADTPLRLQEGYQLGLKTIDNRYDRVDLELQRNGIVVDAKAVYPSKDNANIADKTYYYKKDLGAQKGLVTIAVHIKNAFNDTETAVITVNGIWQLSEKSTPVNLGAKFNGMSVDEVDGNAGTITLNNAGMPITLQKKSDVPLIGDLHLKAADNDTLGFYIYREATEPGTYDLRGAIAGATGQTDNLVDGSFTWNPQNFAGFYYDVDRDLGTETLTTTLTEGSRLSGDYPNGTEYQTTAQLAEFKFKDWGRYRLIGFMAEPCFAGYSPAEDWGSDLLYQKSIDENSLASEQLEKILRDESEEIVLAKGSYLDLEEGYRLLLKGIDESGKAYVELSEDGVTVDSKVIAPGKEGAIIIDKTYYYRTNVGAQNGLVTIAVHFKDAVNDGRKSEATVDGIWQISGAPISVKPDMSYGNMRIRSIDANSGVIAMDNKDNAMILNRNRDVSLFPGIGLKTADNDSLRFFIYKQEDI
ncbi:MAG: S-layer protein [Methanothrix sp.]|nr:MAG: S-layer protein [Methanothrix sp.]